MAEEDSPRLLGSDAVGSQSLSPASGDPGFTSESFTNLRDLSNVLDYPGRQGLVAERQFYPETSTSTLPPANPGDQIPVDPAIVNGRLLTGFDFDIESIGQDREGNFWFAEQLRPFLFKTGHLSVDSRALQRNSLVGLSLPLSARKASLASLASLSRRKSPVKNHPRGPHPRPPAQRSNDIDLRIDSWILVGARASCRM